MFIDLKSVKNCPAYGRPQATSALYFIENIPEYALKKNLLIVILNVKKGSRIKYQIERFATD